MIAYQATLALGAPAVAVLVLRAFSGVQMMVHGIPKLGGKSREGMRSMMSQVGVPGPLFDAVALLEAIGGLFLALGLLTGIAALLFALEMLANIGLYLTKFSKPPMNKGYVGGWELDALLLAAFVSILLLGPGALSVDHALGIAGLPLG